MVVTFWRPVAVSLKLWDSALAELMTAWREVASLGLTLSCEKLLKKLLRLEEIPVVEVRLNRLVTPPPTLSDAKRLSIRRPCCSLSLKFRSSPLRPLWRADANEVQSRF